MACAVKFKHKDWSRYQFLTLARTGSYFKANAARFEEKEQAQEFVARNRERNPDVFFRIEPL